MSHDLTKSPLGGGTRDASAAGHNTLYRNLTGMSAAELSAFSRGYLPELLGIENLVVEAQCVRARVPVRRELMAPHGYLHGGAIVSVADSLCGYGTIINLPDDATGFVTLELKSNFLGTIRHGAMMCEATPAHIGRSTQVWDAVLTDERDNRMLAIFRCSQMVLRNRAAKREQDGGRGKSVAGPEATPRVPGCYY